MHIIRLHLTPALTDTHSSSYPKQHNALQRYQSPSCVSQHRITLSPKHIITFISGTHKYFLRPKTPALPLFHSPASPFYQRTSVSFNSNTDAHTSTIFSKANPVVPTEIPTHFIFSLSPRRPSLFLLFLSPSTNHLRFSFLHPSFTNLTIFLHQPPLTHQTSPSFTPITAFAIPIFSSPLIPSLLIPEPPTSPFQSFFALHLHHSTSAKLFADPSRPLFTHTS